MATSSHPPPQKHTLINGVSDYTLSLIVPVVTHWLTAAVYEVFERYQLFYQYKIHTSAEEKTKNTITRMECLRGVILVQILQTGLGIMMNMLFTEGESTPNAQGDLMAWADLVRCWRRTIVMALSGGSVSTDSMDSMDPFSRSATGTALPFPPNEKAELLLAKMMYYGLIPVLRFYLALRLADTWVFFIHRAEHSNQWLYRNFHARHHELYVPYSWGGIYDHPLESLFLSVGAFVVAVVGSGMTLREGMVFSAFSSFKSCTDHSGYALPWNPVDILTTVDAGYHDKHHQRWGLKKNFALHFRFWDRLWGTEFTDEQVACQLYARDRQAAEMKKSKIKAS